MKNLVLILAIASNFLMQSCKKDEPVVYWYSYGTFYESDASTVGFIVNLDNGKELIPVEFAGKITNHTNGTKVLVAYAIVSETETVVNAKVSDMANILSKDIVQLTEENKDSIGNDAVFVRDGDIWLTERHLNVTFSYFGYNTKHYINLVKPIGEQLDADGNQILEFKHNANEDISYARYNGLVAFDMWSLHEEGMDSLNFVFKSFDYDSTEYSYKGTFYYNADSPSKIEQRSTQDYFETVY